MTSLLSVRFNFLLTVIFSSEYAIHTVPTGLSLVPPPGPAIPEDAIPIDVLNFILIFFAISSSVSLDTAPKLLIVLGEIPHSSILILLLYAINDPLKYFDDPGIEVIRLDTYPPVQLSAIDKSLFLLFSKSPIIFSSSSES